MKTAAAYLRVSTDKQDEYSLDSQLKLIREYAAKNDYIVPDEFVFCDDGISGRTAKKRPEFRRMVAWAKEKDHPFEVILVWKFSRFARNQEESIVYKSMLSRSGVDVISISEPLAEGPFGSLIERILEWMDEFYSIRLSGEVKRGMTEKVSRGEVVTIPSFGYDIKDGVYVPNADAALVQQMYRDYLSGKGVTAIARELAARGVRTRRGNIPENRWVRYILENPVYIGKLRWSSDGKQTYGRGKSTEGSYTVDGHHERIIDVETWEAVQDRIATQTRGRRPYERLDQPVEWMLKGLVRCSACGATLTYNALSCPSIQCHRYSRGQCQVSHSLSIAKANRQVIASLEYAAENLVFPLAPHTVKVEESGPDYEHLIAVERVKLRRIQEAYEGEVYTLQEYAQRKKEISSNISALQEQAAQSAHAAQMAAADPLVFRKKVLAVLDIIKDPSQSETAKNQALRSVVSYIIFEKEKKRLAIYFYA